jgi:putative ABC transport system substrate-binding protein
VIHRRFIFMSFAAAGFGLTGIGRAQQRRLRVGFLNIGPPDTTGTWIRQFNEGLREQGFEDGRNVTYESRWAANVGALPALAAELAALPVDVILAGNNNQITASQRATSTIPIVMVLGLDPVRNGFIDSYARPGRNITGLTNDTGSAMNGKMLGLLKELAPAAAVIGVLAQQGLGYDRAGVDEAARLLKLQLHYSPEVQQPQDIEPAFEAMKRAGAQAVYVIGGTVIYLQRQAVVELELRHRLPGIHFSVDYVHAGGLMSYGIDIGAQFRRSAWYVARILNGAKPAELAVEQPARMALAINSKTAKALALTIPQSMLLRADEVIE